MVPGMLLADRERHHSGVNTQGGDRSEEGEPPIAASSTKPDPARRVGSEGRGECPCSPSEREKNVRKERSADETEKGAPVLKRDQFPSKRKRWMKSSMAREAVIPADYMWSTAFIVCFSHKSAEEKKEELRVCLLDA